MIDRYKPDTALFTMTDCEEAVSMAKDYIRGNGYTNKDVKIVRRMECVQVITIREILWSEIHGAS